MSSIGYATYLGKKAIEVGWNGLKVAGNTAWNFGTICYKKPQFGFQNAIVVGGLITAYKLAKSGVEWSLDPREIKIKDGKNLGIAAACLAISAASVINDLNSYRCALQGKTFDHYLADVPNVQGCV